MKLVKRSMEINGWLTSVALEQPFWDELNEIVEENGYATISKLIEYIYSLKLSEPNKARGLRLFCLARLKRQAKNP